MIIFLPDGVDILVFHEKFRILLFSRGLGQKFFMMVRLGFTSKLLQAVRIVLACLDAKTGSDETTVETSLD